MLDRRAVVIPASLFAGVALATLLWLLTGNGADRRLAEAQAGLSPDLAHAQHASSVDLGVLSALLAKPLFPTAATTGATADAAIVVQGLARSPSRVAALVSFGGGEPQWLTLGQSAGEITLVDVGSDNALFDTPQGLKRVTLGEQPATPDAARAASSGHGANAGPLR